jgi:hypothetical protein
LVKIFEEFEVGNLVAKKHIDCCESTIIRKYLNTELSQTDTANQNKKNIENERIHKCFIQSELK